MSSTQDMELLRRELEVVCGEIIELRRQATKLAVDAPMAQPVSKPRLEDRRVVKPEPSVPGRCVGDWMGVHPRRLQ